MNSDIGEIEKSALFSIFISACITFLIMMTENTNIYSPRMVDTEGESEQKKHNDQPDSI